MPTLCNQCLERRTACKLRQAAKETVFVTPKKIPGGAPMSLGPLPPTAARVAPSFDESGMYMPDAEEREFSAEDVEFITRRSSNKVCTRCNRIAGRSLPECNVCGEGEK